MRYARLRTATHDFFKKNWMLAQLRTIFPMELEKIGCYAQFFQKKIEMLFHQYNI